VNDTDLVSYVEHLGRNVRAGELCRVSAAALLMGREPALTGKQAVFLVDHWRYLRRGLNDLRAAVEAAS
jgi:hypothetical protein